MDVAVFLSFGFVLDGYHHTAGAAEQAAKGHWLSGFILLAKTTQRDDFLHLVKQFFAHQRCMFALVLFASIDEMPVIKRISQNLFDLIWFIHLSAFGFDATRIQIIRYVLKSALVFGIQLKYLDHQWCACLVYMNSFVLGIVVVTKWRVAGVFTAPYFLPQTALGVLAQVVYIILALPKGNIEHKLALRSIFKPKGLKLQIGKFTLVKQINNLSAVYTVTRQSVGVPRQNPVSFAVLYAFQHRPELIASWYFGGFLFNNGIYDC